MEREGGGCATLEEGPAVEARKGGEGEKEPKGSGGKKTEGVAAAGKGDRRGGRGVRGKGRRRWRRESSKEGERGERKRRRGHVGS